MSQPPPPPPPPPGSRAPPPGTLPPQVPHTNIPSLPPSSLPHGAPIPTTPALVPISTHQPSGPTLIPISTNLPSAPSSHHHQQQHHVQHLPPPRQQTPPPPTHARAPPFPGYEDFQFFRVTMPADFVAHAEIHRPQKLNAFSEPVWLEFGALFRQFARDPNVRAIVISGAGDRAFTSGLDVKAAAEGPLANFEGQDVARAAAVLRGHIGDFQDCISAMDVVGKPVVAAVHGVCVGLGVDIVCCADVRFAAADVRFAVKEVDIGMAADIGSLARLPKIVGNQSWVREVCFTARAWGAHEAERVGFVSKVCVHKDETLAQAIGLARFIAEKSPVAVQGTKEILIHARDHSVEDNLRFTAVWNGAALQSTDFKSAMLSGFNKRKTKFEKL